jgi:hypothetical protein
MGSLRRTVGNNLSDHKINKEGMKEVSVNSLLQCYIKETGENKLEQ